MLFTVLLCFLFAVYVLERSREQDVEMEHRKQSALEAHDVSALAEIARQRASHGYRGEGVDGSTWAILCVAFALTGVLAIATLWRVLQRFRTASSDVVVRDVKPT
jgi:hypothetical protein